MDNKDTGFVFILESPSADDLLDGRTEGKALTEALKLSGINGCYSLITSKETFYKALHERLATSINAFPSKWPILHFSMHGNDNGLALLNGEFILWDELRLALTPLNEAMEGRSLLCMSSCQGAAGIKMAMNEDKEKPFGALIGNSLEASWSDATVAYVTFYHRFFQNTPLPEAVEAMQIASGNKNFMFWEGSEIKSNWINSIHEKRLELGSLLNQQNSNDGLDQGT